MRRWEWSRSRYWLCYFLYSRHERSCIHWDQEPDRLVGDRSGLFRWLRRCRQSYQQATELGRSLITGASRDCRHDHAYIQCLRLLVKEQQFHVEMIERLLARYDMGQPWRDWLGNWVQRWIQWYLVRLGSRFEMSILLFADLLDLRILAMLPQLALGQSSRVASAFGSDAVLREVCQNLERDKQAHLAFAAERLATLYADFNFIRRNLRRLRLRLMWVVLLLAVVLRHGRLICGCGISRRRFVLDGYEVFGRLLECMVPYRRDALMLLLLSQRQDPYAEPRRIAP